MRGGQAGLTLVELMIAVVISGLVISAALAMGFSMMNGYRDHRAMVLVERSARVSLDIMADAVRNSSPGVKDGQFADIVGCSGDVAGLYVDNNTDKPDELYVIYATGGVFTSLYDGNDDTAGYEGTDTTVHVLDADPSRGGIDGPEFAAGDYVIFTNLDSGAIVPITDVSAAIQCPATTTAQTCYTLTTDKPNDCTKTFTWATGGSFKTGSLAIRGRYARFFIEDGVDVGGVPTLMMDPDAGGDLQPEPIAEGIEDMQIAIAYDWKGTVGSIDETVPDPDPDDDDWFYNVEGDSLPEDVLPADAIPRAIRITLVARSTVEQSEVASYERPAVEDHAADFVKDVYRRRVLSTTVEIRNLDGSP